MTSAEALLLALLAVFSLPWALWRLSGGGIRLPLVVVQIVGGILLGPGVLGEALPDLHAALDADLDGYLTAPELRGLVWGNSTISTAG